MAEFDVAIIGAGPAGSVAAHRLASAGLKVILLEKEAFPRLKTCGDLVAREGLEALERTGLGNWIEQFKEVAMLRFTSPDALILDIPIERKNGKPLARIIPRRLMDALLTENAMQAGANFKDRIRVDQVSVESESGVRISAGKDSFEAQMVILADGSHAPVTRKLGLIKSDLPDLIAVRQYLAGDSDPFGPLEFHFQKNIIPGYTWMFPMGDGHLNVGAGTYTTRTRKGEVDLRAVVESFIENHPLKADRLHNTEPASTLKGHPLHTNLRMSQTHADRVLVAGDAAGLVSPFTGEGIAAALCSGEQAAGTILQALKAGSFNADRLSSYSAGLRKRYLADQDMARLLRSVLKNPGLLNRVFSHMRNDPDLGRLFGMVYLDENSPNELVKIRTLLRLFV